jgi:hypothetical protein
MAILDYDGEIPPGAVKALGKENEVHIGDPFFSRVFCEFHYHICWQRI